MTETLSPVLPRFRYSMLFNEIITGYVQSIYATTKNNISDQKSIYLFIDFSEDLKVNCRVKISGKEIIVLAVIKDNI